jgi:hypothetical protein
MWYWRGALAATVMDNEAIDILMDYITKYYYQDHLYNEEEFFSKAYDDAAKRIMTVHRSPWIPVMIVAGIAVILLLLFIWWRRSKEQKNKEAEQTERILNQPLETFEGSGAGDDEASRLARQYEDDNKK